MIYFIIHYRLKSKVKFGTYGGDQGGDDNTGNQCQPGYSYINGECVKDLVWVIAKGVHKKD